MPVCPQPLRKLGNPLRWDCAASGKCFNTYCRPKIEVFADCFPRRIKMGDVDGLVEINGLFLLLEWKRPGQDVPQGQRIAYEHFSRLTRGCVVFCVRGHADTMEVVDYCLFWDGRQWPWLPAGLEDLQARMAGWAAFADGRRA